MQTFIDPIASFCLDVLHGIAHRPRRLKESGLGLAHCGLYAPQPRQYVHREDSDSGPCGHTRKGFFRARLAMCELIAADHDGDQAGHSRNGSGKQHLDGSKAVVKRGAAVLGVGHQRSHNEENEKSGGRA